MQKSEPMAGGVFIALGAITGVAIGHYQGQTSAGLLIGLAIGTVVALLVWRRTR